VAGKSIGQGQVGSMPKALARKAAGLTHAINCGGAIVGLTAAEAQTITTAIEAARAASPALAARRLREERERLQCVIRGELDECDYQRNKAHERDMGGIPSYDNPRVSAAYAALAAFDTEHPEIKEQISAERAERIKRTMWD